MAHIVALSSWVAHGHVGLSAAVPVLQALGHQVTQLPTVQLSNHPGFSHVSGARTEVATLRAMIDALARNGWLDHVDAVLTGYLPSAEHVALAGQIIDRLRENSMRPVVVVDPVLGDAPKGLYIAEAAAEAIRDVLLPKADILTPNVFELGWLTGAPAESLDQTMNAARTLRDLSRGADIFVTSPPISNTETGVLATTSGGTDVYRTPSAPHDTEVPHGVGDVFSGIIAGGLPVGQALGHLHALIQHSLNAPHLRIAETAPIWTQASAVPPDPQHTVPLTGSH